MFNLVTIPALNVFNFDSAVKIKYIESIVTI